jgi:hypothetical protein
MSKATSPKWSPALRSSNLLLAAGYLGPPIKDNEEIVTKLALLAQGRPRCVFMLPPTARDATKLPG